MNNFNDEQINNINETSIDNSFPGYTDETFLTQYVKDEEITVEVPALKVKKKGGVGRFFKRFALISISAVLFGAVAAVMFNVVDDYIDDRYDDEEYTDEYAERTDQFITDEYAADDPIETVVVEDNKTVQGLDVSNIAESVMPSVVSITIKAVEEYGYGMFGGAYESEGSGSGIIIGENETELLIVTNNHVVSDAETVTVSFIDESVYEAKVKGTDSDSDLAIIVVDLEDLSQATRDSIKIAKLGNSDELKVGEQVVAIGNALGYGQSVTTGIVSALNRTNSTNVTPLIQTDAAINPGNSGGALLNMKGEVIGINSSKYMSTEVEGMGYAIPISEVEDILDELMNRETREKVDENEVGYLGVGCATVDEQASYVYGIPMGALVSEVMEGSPAHKSGIKKNNIIVEFDGVEISSAEQLVDLLEYYRAGEKVVVTVAYLADEDYVEKEIEVVLGRRATSISE